MYMRKIKSKTWKKNRWNLLKNSAPRFLCENQKYENVCLMLIHGGANKGLRRKNYRVFTLSNQRKFKLQRPTFRLASRTNKTKALKTRAKTVHLVDSQINKFNFHEIYPTFARLCSRIRSPSRIRKGKNDT